MSTGTVPNALFMHIIGKFVYNIFAIDPVITENGEDVRKHFCLAHQLWAVIQDKFAKAPKSKALLEALTKLLDCEKNIGQVDSELVDKLYSGYVAAFPANQLSIDALMQDKELCFDVSRMVVEKLIHHWTPSVLFSDPIVVGSEFISERRGGAEMYASCTLWRSLTQDLSSYRKLTKKGSSIVFGGQ